MRTDYQIGTTELNMVSVINLVSGRTAPPSNSIVKPYSVYRTAASGMEYGDGQATCSWTFEVMTTAFFNAMIAYLGGAVSANVYIKTRKDDNTFDVYTAIMHRPVFGEGFSRGTGVWRDVTFEFTNLEEA
mgnify:CR=1 FL=1